MNKELDVNLDDKKTIQNNIRRTQSVVLLSIFLSTVSAFCFPSRTQSPACASVFDYHVRLPKDLGPSDADHIIDQYRSILVDTKKYNEASFYFFQFPEPVTYFQLDQMMAKPIQEMEIYGDSHVKILLTEDHRTVAVISSKGLPHTTLAEKFRPREPGVESLGGSRIEQGTRLINSRHFSYFDGVSIHMEYFGKMIQFNPPLHLSAETTTATYLFHQEMEARQQARRALSEQKNQAHLRQDQVTSPPIPMIIHTEENISSSSPSTSTNGFLSRVKTWLMNFRSIAKKN